MDAAGAGETVLVGQHGAGKKGIGVAVIGQAADQSQRRFAVGAGCQHQLQPRCQQRRLSGRRIFNARFPEEVLIAQGQRIDAV